MNVTVSNYTLLYPMAFFGAGVWENELILFAGYIQIVTHPLIECRFPTAAVWDYDPLLSQWKINNLTYIPFDAYSFRFLGDSVVQIPGTPIVYGSTPNMNSVDAAGNTLLIYNLSVGEFVDLAKYGNSMGVYVVIMVMFVIPLRSVPLCHTAHALCAACTPKEEN